METIKMYRCECGEDVYEDDTFCVSCNAPVDASKFEEAPVAQIKETPRNDRRVRRVTVAPQAMISFLRSGGKVFQNGLPADSTFVGGGYDFFTNEFVVFVRSKEFAFVPEGTSAPHHGSIGLKAIE